MGNQYDLNKEQHGSNIFNVKILNMGGIFGNSTRKIRYIFTHNAFHVNANTWMYEGLFPPTLCSLWTVLIEGFCQWAVFKEILGVNSRPGVSLCLRNGGARLSWRLGAA
jgi:hypothetical protein